MKILFRDLEKIKTFFREKKTKSWKRVAEKLAEFEEFFVFLERVLPLPTVRL